jgi:hypothetical protein
MDQDRIRAIQFDCEQLIRRYVHLNDAGDWDALATLFAVDASFARPHDPTNRIQGRASLLAFFKGRPARLGRHFVANTVVTVESETAARAESYVILYLASQPAEPGKLPKADPTQAIGAFSDRFVLTDEGWRFAERIGSLAMTT